MKKLILFGAVTVGLWFTANVVSGNTITIAYNPSVAGSFEYTTPSGVVVALEDQDNPLTKDDDKDWQNFSSLYGPELYKNDRPDESGDFKDSYYTDYYDTPSDPSDAIVSYVNGAAHINTNPIYLEVKDGGNAPIWYLFKISGWNGTDTIKLLDFWPNNGAISHVTVYGRDAGNNFPDSGGTIALFGMAICLLCVAQRKITA